MAATNKKMTKVDTLRLAVQYIQQLTSLLHGHSSTTGNKGDESGNNSDASGNLGETLGHKGGTSGDTDDFIEDHSNFLGEELL